MSVMIRLLLQPYKSSFSSRQANQGRADTDAVKRSGSKGWIGVRSHLTLSPICDVFHMSRMHVIMQVKMGHNSPSHGTHLLNVLHLKHYNLLKYGSK